MRAAVYTRVSTRDKGQETENQLRQLREFCAAQGWPIVAEYEDHESGGKANRAQFRAMMADASRRRFDVVVVWALDRFSREGVPETFDHISHLSSHGVQFVSFTEAHFRTTGPVGELMIAVAAWIAKQERVRISSGCVPDSTEPKSKEPGAAIRWAGRRLYSTGREPLNFAIKENRGERSLVRAGWARPPFGGCTRPCSAARPCQIRRPNFGIGFRLLVHETTGRANVSVPDCGLKF